MPRIFRPRIVYPGGTFDPSLPMRWWEPREGGLAGGEDVSGAGVPVGYYVGWATSTEVTIRFRDAELAAWLAFLRWTLQNKSTPWTFRFDRANAATQFTVYTESPKVTDRTGPRRDQKAPWAWEQALTIRSTTGAPFVVASHA
jgi:hypothetical protein